MEKVEFVDQTIRDAQQSSWAFLMRTDMIIPIAPTMDQVGFKTISTVGGHGFTVQIRNSNENPWERQRSISKLMPNTPVRGSYMTASIASFDVATPRSLIELWIKRSVANGVKGFWVCDYQNDMDSFYYFAKIAKDEGAEVITSLMYTFSPAHTNEYWAKKVRLIAEGKDYVDGIMIEDAGGVLTPGRTRELIKVILDNCDDIPIEFHSHCTSGLAPLCYLEAVKSGVRILHTAASPLANGNSLPSTEGVLKNVRRTGYATNIDENALAEVSTHFRNIAEREGLPIGVPVEYDIFQFEHQVPGGMMTNLKRQLNEVGMKHRLNEILEEIILVRKDLGYPVMATPYSQIVGVQAMENILSGERYKKVTDEVIKYVLGYYGKPAAPVEPNVKDKILSQPRANSFLNWDPRAKNKSIEEMRQEIDPDISDDDLLLRMLIPGKLKKGTEKNRRPVKSSITKPSETRKLAAVYPANLRIDVDGDVFNVKIISVGDGSATIEAYNSKELPRQSTEINEIPQGALVSGITGMIISIKVNTGDSVKKGDVLATIEAMKMIREIPAPNTGEIKSIHVQEGDMVDANDILMVLQ